MPRPGEELRAAGCELEHGGRHYLEKPAVVRNQHDGGIEADESALQPLEVVDVEVVRGLVQQQQVGISGQRTREGGACQLSAGERVEWPVEIVLREAEAAQGRCRALAPGPAARMLELRLRVAVAP